MYHLTDIDLEEVVDTFAKTAPNLAHYYCAERSWQRQT